MQSCKNSHGFTLIESMIALSFLVILASLFPLWLQVIHHSEKDETIDPMEVELFFQETGMEIREAIEVKQSSEGNLILQMYDGQAVDYKEDGIYISRQVDRKGYERVLQNISAFNIDIHHKGVTLSITGKKGVTYERTFAQLVPKQ